MIILAKDDARYLVKTNSADDKCYLVDTNAMVTFDYDRPYKFFRFGYWNDFNQKDLTKELENKIIKALKTNNI